MHVNQLNCKLIMNSNLIDLAIVLLRFSYLVLCPFYSAPSKLALLSAILLEFYINGSAEHKFKSKQLWQLVFFLIALSMRSGAVLAVLLGCAYSISSILTKMMLVDNSSHQYTVNTMVQTILLSNLVFGIFLVYSGHESLVMWVLNLEVVVLRAKTFSGSQEFYSVISQRLQQMASYYKYQRSYQFLTNTVSKLPL